MKSKMQRCRPFEGDMVTHLLHIRTTMTQRKDGVRSPLIVSLSSRHATVLPGFMHAARQLPDNVMLGRAPMSALEKAFNFTER